MKCNKCNYIKINICVCYKFDSILSIHRITYPYLLIMSLQTESVSDSVSPSELSLLEQKKELLQEIINMIWNLPFGMIVNINGNEMLPQLSTMSVNTDVIRVISIKIEIYTYINDCNYFKYLHL